MASDPTSEAREILGDAIVFGPTIAQVGSCDVMRAAWVGDGAPRVVVLRRLRHSFESDDVIARFALTARLHALLGGDHVPRPLAAFGDRARIEAYVEEDAGDVTLRDLVRACSPVPIGIALMIARAMAVTWTALDETGHDVAMAISPDDVVLGWDGVPRFLVEPYPGPDPRAEPRGDFDWLAPELTLGEPVTNESAMFACGMLIHELLSGKLSFHDSAGVDPVLARLERPVAPLPPRVPAHVRALVGRCTRKRPPRYTSWESLIEAIDRAPVAAPADLQAMLVRSFPERLAEAQRREVVASELARTRPDVPFLPWPMLPETELAWVPLPPRVLTVAPAAVEIDAWGEDARPMLRFASGKLIDNTCVTHTEYRRFAVATERDDLPPMVSGPPYRTAEDPPVTGVSIEDARAYAAWAGKRLPLTIELTEAEAALGADRLALGRVREHAEDAPLDPAGDVGFRCVADAR